MAACESCGAALAADADVCDLCGTPAASAADATRACANCGQIPPPGSAFCNACGEPLAGASRSAGPSPAARSPVARPAASPNERPAAAGKRALVVVGVGLLVVVALYAVTVLSPRPEPAPEPTDEAAVGEAAPIPPGAPPLPDTLQAAADRFASLGTAEGFYESGRYYLTAAFQLVQSDPTTSVRYARRAIEEFERSLAIEEDPRVRVALAEAATFDPSDPMRPIQELRAVLDADPGNLDATFLLAERRMMIGRVDSARAAFERVVAEAPAGSAVRQRAEEALAQLDAEGG